MKVELKKVAKVAKSPSPKGFESDHDKMMFQVIAKDVPADKTKPEDEKKPKLNNSPTLRLRNI